MLYDENGRILNEYHSDGLNIDYTYDSKNGKIIEVKNSQGVKEQLAENTDGTINVQVLKDDKIMLEKKEYETKKLLDEKMSIQANSDNTLIKQAAEVKLVQNSSAMPTETSITPNSKTQYEDYTVNGKKHEQPLSISLVCSLHYWKPSLIMA